jgi:NADPH-dependent curcumin reductase CurA
MDVAGIDQAINYKTCTSLERALGDAFPTGINIYFDNVGGQQLEAALNQMSRFGRIALCGMIAQYNDTEQSPGPANLGQAIGKRLRLEGFIVSDHADLLPQFLSEVGALLKSGRIQRQVTVEEGIENAPKALLRLFIGNKSGKMLVRLAS